MAAVRKASSRYRSLDGVRGIAALTVLCCHALIALPTYLQGYVDPTVIEKGTWMWWATFSPIHLAWAGTEAVYVFFVLSGFVLTLPFIKNDAAKWAGYYPKRLIRLYLPVWGAFALTAFWIYVFPRNFPAHGSVWLHTQVADFTSAAVKSDLLLTPGAHLNNGVLWTLTFEIAFSLLLPLYLIAGKFLPKLNLLKFAVLLGMIVAYADTGTTFQFHLPMFGLGVLMALERKNLAALGQKIWASLLGWPIWIVLTLISLCALNASWTLRGVVTDPGELATLGPVSRGVSLFGACLLLFCAVEGPLRLLLEGRTVQWLGSRSFSLYLVHNPIVLAVAVFLGSGLDPLMSLLVSVPASLLVAEAFYQLVERPSQKMSRAADQSIRSLPLWRRPAQPQYEPAPVMQFLTEPLPEYAYSRPR